jgi:hypothetical protein
VARSVSRPSRIAGLALGAGGALTLALAAATLFLLPFLAPFAVLEAVAGIRVFAGRLGSAWLGIPGSLIGLWLGIGTIDGFAGPIAVASVAVNAMALVVTAAVGLSSLGVPGPRPPGDIPAR